MSFRLPAPWAISLSMSRSGYLRGGSALGQNFKRDREQRVAREDGDAVTEDFVASGAAAAEIVIVHARQIVVHERVGVDALHGAGERHGCGNFAAACFSRREAQDRAKSLAAGEEAVTHRLVNSGRTGVR